MNGSLSAIRVPTTTEAVHRLTSDEVEARYRPFRTTKNNEGEPDWIESLELDTVQKLAQARSEPVKVLVLYGSLRERSFSRLTAYEASRILSSLGADVRVYNPLELPIKGACPETHEKVAELRSLCDWSDAHLWVSPEQHGTITAVMKNQIDWIPLSTGSVRPTQGRTLAICQVNGGSQSFNTVNVLRQLGRWMRMFTIPNQSSIPKAWTQYTDSDRLLPSSNRDRLVDVCEELVKTTILLQPHFDLLGDRYSEREEKRAHGRLRTQAEVEKTLKNM
ncbi:arsenate resistance ArsH [Rhodotorula sp. JG-1b]|nr:arsenate resistance ArsH [Rhodotorula sp. JG-1b]